MRTISRLLLGGAYLGVLAAGVIVPRATGGYVRGSARFRDGAREGARLALFVAGAVAVAFARPAVILLYGRALESTHTLLQLGAAFLFLNIAGAAIVLLGSGYGATGATVAVILWLPTSEIMAGAVGMGLYAAAVAVSTASTRASR